MKFGILPLICGFFCTAIVALSDSEPPFEKGNPSDIPIDNPVEADSNIKEFNKPSLSGDTNAPNSTNEKLEGEIYGTANDSSENGTDTFKDGMALGNRRLGSSRYKSGRQQVSINERNLLSDDVPRHGALMHKNPKKFDTEKTKDDNEVSVLETGEGTMKRKKRISSSSATPSVQIIFMVIGAVVGCVLLTGFIRWRVRDRLNAAKQKKMSEEDDDCVIYHGKSIHHRPNEMDIIYECECEEGQGLLHSHDSDELCTPHEMMGSKFDEITCSNRFDIPLSVMSQTFSGGLDRPKSPKCGRDLALIRGPKRRRYGYKGRYSRHQKRRLNNMFVQKLETIPMENSTPSHDDGKSINYFYDEQHPSASSQPPRLPKRSSPPVFRGTLASILNSWRSLSFNRDWVGKVWQDQHNIRRLSDIVRRRLSRGRGSQSGDSRSVSSISDTDSYTDVLSISSSRSASRQGLNVAEQTINNISETSFPMGIVGDLKAEEIIPVHAVVPYCRSAVVINIGKGSNMADNTNTSDPANDSLASIRDNIRRKWSFSDDEDEPVEYAKLYNVEGHLRNTASWDMDDLESLQRRQRKRRLEDRERSSSFGGTIQI